MFDKTNTGTLSKAKNRKSEKSPEHTGKLNVGGEEYRLAGWVQDGQYGKFISLRVKTEAEYQAKRAPAKTTDFDDDIPF